MRFTVLGPTTMGTQAFDKFAVVSSETAATTYWADGDEEQGLNTTFSLTNCTFAGFTRIGLIQPNSSDVTAGNEALDNIFTKLSAAYAPNWQESGETLEKVIFEDDAALTTYVKKSGYAD